MIFNRISAKNFEMNIIDTMIQSFTIKILHGVGQSFYFVKSLSFNSE